MKLVRVVCANCGAAFLSGHRCKDILGLPVWVDLRLKPVSWVLVVDPREPSHG